MPTWSSPYALLEHFLSSTVLSIDLENLDSFDVRKNVAFHPVLIHAVSARLAELQPQQQSFFLALTRKMTGCFASAKAYKPSCVKV